MQFYWCTYNSHGSYLDVTGICQEPRCFLKQREVYEDVLRFCLHHRSSLPPHSVEGFLHVHCALRFHLVQVAINRNQSACPPHACRAMHHHRTAGIGPAATRHLEHLHRCYGRLRHPVIWPGDEMVLVDRLLLGNQELPDNKITVRHFGYKLNKQPCKSALE